MKRTHEDVESDARAIRAALRRRPRTVAEIADLLGGVAPSTARRYLERLTASGDRIVRDGLGYPVRYGIEAPGLLGPGK